MYRLLAGGRWCIVFLSAHFQFCVDRAPLAQSGELRTFNPQVVGFEPPQGALADPSPPASRGSAGFASSPSCSGFTPVDPVWMGRVLPGWPGSF